MRRIRCCCWCWGEKDKVLLLMLRRFCCRCWVELRRIRCCCWCWGEKETLLFLLLLLLWQGPVFYCCCWLKRIRCCSSSWGDEWLLLRWCYTIVVRMLRRYWRLFHLVVLLLLRSESSRVVAAVHQHPPLCTAVGRVGRTWILCLLYKMFISLRKRKISLYDNKLEQSILIIWGVCAKLAVT